MISDYSGPVTVDYDHIESRDLLLLPRFQNIQFIKDDSDNYGIVGLYNTDLASRQFNQCYFLSMTLDARTTGSSPSLVQPKIKRERILRTRTNHKYYNFGHVGGIYVDGKKRMIIYGGGTKRKGNDNNIFSFAEFAPLMNSQDPPLLDEFENGLIELIGYKEPEINRSPRKFIIDRILKLDLSKLPRLDFYKNTIGLGGNFNDKTGAVRWCLPNGDKVSFYEDSDRNTGDDGTNPGTDKNELKLVGTGNMETIPDLKVTPNNRLKDPNKRFWKKISSHSKA